MDPDTLKLISDLDQAKTGINEELTRLTTEEKTYIFKRALLMDFNALTDGQKQLIGLITAIYITDHAENTTTDQTNQPYIQEHHIETTRKYNPKYGPDRTCECGHPYFRHFDSYESMRDVGCKYCPCHNFKEKT